MADSVCAVVVTYNRKNLLLECLEALRKQTRPVDAIYLIDNASSDGTPEMLLEQGYILELPPKMLSEPWEIEQDIPNLKDGRPIRVHYVRMHANTGGAGGFYEGMKRAYEKGYNWFWLMDDDAEPEERALERLEKFFDDSRVVALAPLVLDSESNVLWQHRGYFFFQDVFRHIVRPIGLADISKEHVEIDLCSFVGLLVRKEAVKKIGLPEKRFFIHHDDVEYCIRLRNIGNILLVTDSVIIHKEIAKSGLTKKGFLLRRYRVSYDKFWLSYYGIRNLVFLGRKYSGNRIKFYFKLAMRFLRLCVGVILWDDHKLRRIKLITNSFIDGLRGRFDNEKPKKILYWRCHRGGT